MSQKMILDIREVLDGVEKDAIRYGWDPKIAKQRIFLQHYRQLMDGCIVQRVQYAPWCTMGRAGKWKRLDILEINRKGLFPLLYEYLPQMNVERYNKYYGLEEEPVLEGRYDSYGLRFEHS